MSSLQWQSQERRDLQQMMKTWSPSHLMYLLPNSLAPLTSTCPTAGRTLPALTLLLKVVFQCIQFTDEPTVFPDSEQTLVRAWKWCMYVFQHYLCYLSAKVCNLHMSLSHSHTHTPIDCIVESKAKSNKQSKKKSGSTKNSSKPAVSSTASNSSKTVTKSSPPPPPPPPPAASPAPTATTVSSDRDSENGRVASPPPDHSAVVGKTVAESETAVMEEPGKSGTLGEKGGGEEGEGRVGGGGKGGEGEGGDDGRGGEEKVAVEEVTEQSTIATDDTM